MPFWWTGRPVRMADLLGLQLLTEVNALVKTALLSASRSRCGVFTVVFPSAPICITASLILIFTINTNNPNDGCYQTNLKTSVVSNNQ